MRRTKEEAEKTRIAILASAERLFLDKGVATPVSIRSRATLA